MITACLMPLLLAETNAFADLAYQPLAFHSDQIKQPSNDQVKQVDRKKELPKTMASWSQRATMSSGRMSFTAAALEDASSPSSKIVVFGGLTWNGQSRSLVTTIEQFDVANNSWTTLPMNYGFQGYTACGEMGNDVYLFGANAGMPPTVYGYNPQATSVSTVGQLVVNRRFPAVVNLKNNTGRILLLGGQPQNSGLSSETSVEVFKAGGTGATLSGVNLGSVPLRNVSAALMPSGKVFIVGQKPQGDNQWTTLDLSGSGSLAGSQQFPNSTAKGRAQVAYSSHHQRLLVVIEPAGLPGNIETFIVDPNTMVWTPGPAPANPGRLNTVLIGSKVGFFLIGGSDANGSCKTIEQL